MFISPQKQPLPHRLNSDDEDAETYNTMADQTTLASITQLWLQESLGVFSQETLDHYSGQILNLIIPFFGDSVEISQ